MPKILAINAGSSSLKFQLLQMPEESLITKGLIERIGMNDAVFNLTVGEYDIKQTMHLDDHAQAVKALLNKLIEAEVIASFDEIDGIGHRVVHGGESFHESVLITDDVIADIEKVSELAPLHNPNNLIGIRAFRQLLPHTPAVAVFDTAFHQTMPEHTYLYSVPYRYYEDYGIRKYGFHGTSHKYVSKRAAEMLQKPIEDLKIISCHLGNGASLAAIEGGRSVDTSMGFTPLAGITMGTRSGDIDPALIPYMMQKTGKTATEVIEVLNNESGILGISGVSSDVRDVERESRQGNHRAEVAMEVFISRIHKYIGSYAAKMNGVDAVIFTAGVGENSPEVRSRVLDGLEFMGIYYDELANQIQGEDGFINATHSPVKVLVIPTNEEIMIARDTLRLSERQSNPIM